MLIVNLPKCIGRAKEPWLKGTFDLKSISLYFIDRLWKTRKIPLCLLHDYLHFLAKIQENFWLNPCSRVLGTFRSKYNIPNSYIPFNCFIFSRQVSQNLPLMYRHGHITFAQWNQFKSHIEFNNWYPVPQKLDFPANRGWRKNAQPPPGGHYGQKLILMNQGLLPQCVRVKHAR